MPPFVISLLSKLGPYAAVALVAFGLGGAAMRRFDEGAIDQVKLALANQQASDAKVTAAWNQKAADFQTQISQLQNSVQAARQTARAADEQTHSTQRVAIATLRAQPGEDAPVAPILAAEHDNLVRELQGTAP